jgi:hypothetical protein
MAEFSFDPPLTLRGNVVVRISMMRFVSWSVIERRADLTFGLVYYTGLKELPAKQRSAVLETHFWTG